VLHQLSILPSISCAQPVVDADTLLRRIVHARRGSKKAKAGETALPWPGEEVVSALLRSHGSRGNTEQQRSLSCRPYSLPLLPNHYPCHSTHNLTPCLCLIP